MSSDQIITGYLQDLRRRASAPHTTEFTFRPALETLLESLAEHLQRPVSHVTAEPGRVTNSGAPDFIIYGQTVSNLIGYVETKDLGRDLDHLVGHDADQFERYKQAFPVWIYTNYLDFRLYENKELKQQVTLAHSQQVRGSVDLAELAASKPNELTTLFDRFFRLSTPTVTSAEDLAGLLAHKARLLEQVILSLMTDEQGGGELESQLEAYRRWLIPELSVEEFADFYAQTLTYGLFFAAYENSERSAPLAFTRGNALRLLPSAVRPIRAIFQLLAAQFLPDELSWIINDLVRLLDRADLQSVASDLGQNRDPTVHFYETFLSQFDPELRDVRGVYYTPDEVVDYIVRSVDHLLREHFQKDDGLASEHVTLLDPAVGTGTFLAHALQQVATKFGSDHAGDLPDHLRQNSLRQWFGFELLAAPYVLAYLKLGQVLEQLNVSDSAPKIYLTNTLSDHQFPQTLPGPFERAISEDGREAQQVKAEQEILVVIGNPPYQGHSYNEYDISVYKQINGKPLRERNPKWLQNDYVKFMRWAEKKLVEASTGSYRHGILAYITDNSYLRAPTMRGMRKHLIESFSDIYILNLHGNSGIGEQPPPGVERDENVFPISQGVAIGLFVRRSDHDGGAKVWYSECWDRRQAKYDYLSENDVSTTDWKQLDPQERFYFFIPHDLPDLSEAYSSWPSVHDDIFRVGSMAMVSGDDGQRYAFEKQTIKDRFGDILDDSNFRLTSFRPFDERYVGFDRRTMTRRRETVMKHLLFHNVALITFRHTRRETPMRVFATRHLADARLLSSESNCYAYPLYIYEVGKTSAGQLALGLAGSEPADNNFKGKPLERLTEQYGYKVSADDVFCYIYGILNAPGYQTQFETLLHVDFPRIPFTSSHELFMLMVARGKRVLELHLLETPDVRGLGNLIVGYPNSGTNRVENAYPEFNPAENRVYINRHQYFEGVTSDMWEYEVGSYQPLEKWLTEHRERVLTAQDRRRYETFATAIQKVLDELPGLDEVWLNLLEGDWFNPWGEDV